jgi:hypothetical protein
MDAFSSPFIIPIAGMAVGVITIITAISAQMYARRMKAEERMAMIARGMSPEEIAKLLGSGEDNAGRIKDPIRSLATARRAGIVLCSAGIGLIIFFIVLALILRVREVYSGAAGGLIPLCIGIGFFIDYHLQQKELARFGMEVEPAPHA